MAWPEAIRDVRVPVAARQPLFNSFPAWQPTRYVTLADNDPLANWHEAWLILAEVEGGQAMIDRSNEIGAFHGLPLVTYADPTDARQIRYMFSRSGVARSFGKDGSGARTS